MIEAFDKKRYGETLGDVVDFFNSLETEEELQRFYLGYWNVVEETINKEEGIEWGDKRKFGLVYARVRSNLHHLLGRVSDMRSDFAQKVWWFL